MCVCVVLLFVYVLVRLRCEGLRGHVEEVMERYLEPHSGIAEPTVRRGRVQVFIPQAHVGACTATRGVRYALGLTVAWGIGRWTFYA